MENSSKKNLVQAKFFEMIQQVLPANHTLVNTISELLNVGTEAGYRRIRGTKLLDLEEIIILCKHFGISFDSAVGVTGKQILCDFGVDKVLESWYSCIEKKKKGHFLTLAI